jgi:hypothetical protein
MSDDEIARLERYFDMRIERLEKEVAEMKDSIRGIVVITKVASAALLGAAGMGVVLAIQYLATH